MSSPNVTELLLEHSPIATLVTRADGTVLYANPSFASLLGVTGADLPGHSALDFYDNQAERLFVQEKLRQQGEVLDHEMRARRADGSPVWISLSIRRFECQDAPAFVSTLVDIGERLHMEEKRQKNEEKFRRFSEATTEGLAFHKHGKIIEANAALAALWGYAEATELIGKNLADLVLPEGREAAVKHLRAAAATTFETTAHRKDGTPFALALSTRPCDYQGQTIRVATLRDITERKQAERALQDSEERYQAIFNSTPVMFWLKDTHNRTLQINRAAANLEGIDPKSVEGKSAYDLYPLEQAEAFYQDDLQVINSGQPKLGILEQHTTVGTGEVTWLETGKIPVRSTQGEITGVLAFAVDVTKSKQIEQFSRESEDRLRQILDAAPVAMLMTRMDGTVVYGNEHFAELFGVPADRLAGDQPPDFYVHPEERQFVLGQLREHGRLQDYEMEAKLADGKVAWVLLSVRMFTLAGETVLLSSLINISARKEVEHALGVRSAVIENSPDLIALATPEGQLTYGNPAALTVTGYTVAELTALHLTDLQPELEADALATARTTGNWIGETTVMHKDGHQIPVTQVITAIKDASGQLQYLATTARDISLRRALQQQIQDSLERRGRQVQLSTQVAQAIAAAASLDDLYTRLVTQINEQFGYYHTQLLRVDSSLKAVVLAKGYGEVGGQMLAAGHRLPLGVGLIGTAAATGQTVLRPTLRDDPDWRPNPLLPDTRGEIAVPIKLGQRVLGVLDVQSSQAGTLSGDDQLLLEGLCGQIATAIENTRLRQEMESRLHELDTLYRAASKEGWQAFGGTLSAGYRYTQPDILPIDAQWAAAVEKAFEKNDPSDPTSQTVAASPLTVRGGEMIGTLGIIDRPLDPLSPDDLSLVEQVSDQVALALDGARLFEQAQKRAAELEAVAQVSTTASTLLEADKLLEAVANLAQRLFGLYHAHIYLLDPAHTQLRLAAGAGDVGQQMVAEGWSIPLDRERSLVARAARERQGVTVNDVRATPDFLPNPLLPDTRAELAVPLLIGDKLLGVFDVQSDRVGRFTSVDVQIHTTLAAQVAVALQNANLYAEQSATVIRLRELDQLKSAFLANMSHELRTPLNSVLGFAQVILEGLDGPLTDNMESDLKLIEKNGQHLLNLINDILDMAKIEAGRVSLSLEPVNIHELLDEVLESARSLARNKSLYLEMEATADTSVVIKIDRIRIHQVILNVIGNAIKFTETGGVRVQITKVDAKVQLWFRDTGIGIPADKLESIFEAFSQVDTSSTRKAGGTGLGLPISRRLVELHGGRLWAESTGMGQGGSVFCLELPLEPGL
jgi:PAS domain S-box-containing protein